MATDQEIRDAGFKYVPQQQYLLNPFELPENQEPVINQGIVATNAFTNSGGGGGGYYPGSPNELVGNYQSIVDARQQRLNNPSDTFLGFNTMKNRPATEASTTLAENIGIPQEMTMMGKVQDFFTPQSAQDILNDGYQEPRFQPGIIGMLAGKIDNYRNLPRVDQAFIAQNMGYTGPTVFGANNSGLSKDAFGINTRSLKGNYGEFVGNKVTDLESALKNARSKYDTEEDYLDMTKMMRTKLDFYRNKLKERDALAKEEEKIRIANLPQEVRQYTQPTRSQKEAIRRERGDKSAKDYGNVGGTSGAMTKENEGTFCFDPSTLIQMADGSTKEIKNIQLGDDTKGGEVTGVFQFKATDEIHDYKGVTVAGSHYVKEDGRFIMVKDSPISVKIDKIPVVYSLDTTGRRIFINNIEFADYNGDGVAKNFLSNAGVNLTGFNKEVLRQVELRLI
mgnify:FL=1